MIVAMDAIDRKIIAELRAHGRLSNVELADRVGLTPAPCLRRVKRLEDDGAIVGYTALLDPVAMGHAFEVLVNVDLAYKDRDTVERFEAEVAALDEVIELRRMFGLPDYIVRVGTADLDTFEAFVTAGLGAVPGIAKIDSHLTMKVVKSPERRPMSRKRGRPARRAR
jgi:DNA-binding Lrp family transcriptional regulator